MLTLLTSTWLSTAYFPEQYPEIFLRLAIVTFILGILVTLLLNKITTSSKMFLGGLIGISYFSSTVVSIEFSIYKTIERKHESGAFCGWFWWNSKHVPYI